MTQCGYFQIEKFYLFIGLILLSVFSFGQPGIRFIDPIDSKFVDTAFIDASGKNIIKVIVPGSPPKTGYLKSATIIPSSAVMLSSLSVYLNRD